MASIRSVLEYSSVVYHSQVNQYQVNLLERVQKRCLRAIYGYSLNYVQLLQISGLETLKNRRQNAFEKFALKTCKNPRYSTWFPLRVTIRETRQNRPYLEQFANSQRLYRSPMFAIRRFLNDQTPVSCSFDDLSGAFNAP